MNRSRITGDLTASGLLYADIANDRVGIGSTIPGNKLSLPDSAKIGLGNAEDLTLYHSGSHSYIDNTTGNLVIKTGGSERLSVNSSGNVTIKDAKQLLFENDANNASSAILNLGASGTSNLVFATGGSEKLRITSAGLVGIGTDISGGGGAHGRLSVVIPSQSGGSALQVMNSAAGSSDGDLTNIVLRSVNNSGTQWAGAEFRAHDYIFKNQTTEALNITNGGCVYASNFGIGTDSNWKIRANTSNTELAFEYATSSTLADTNIKAFFRAGGSFVIKSDPLSAGGTMGDRGLIFQANSTPTDGQVIQGITFCPHDTAIGRARAGIAGVANANGGSHPQSGSDLVFLTRYSADGHDLDVTTDERLRITSTGKMGLGTNDPVGGDFVVENTTGNAAIALSRAFSGNVSGATNTPSLAFTMSDTATNDQVVASISPQALAGTGDAFKGQIRVFTANAAGTNTERLRIGSTGVIETKTRSAEVRRMILSGSPSNSAFNIEAHDGESGTSSGDVQGKLGLFYNDGSTLTNTACISFERGSGAPDGAMAFVTNQSPRLHITSTGIIETETAIGGSGYDSNQRFRVGRAGDCNIAIRNTADTTSHTGIDFGDSGDDRSGRIQYMHNGDYMSFHTNGAGSGSSNERLRIKSDGNIIPGTNNTTSIGDGSTNFNSIWASTRFRGNDNVKLVLGNSQNLVVRYDGSNNIIGSPVGNDLHIKSGTGDNDNQLIACFKHSGGYVGINQSNPQRYLHIVGNDGATNATLGNSDTQLVLDNSGTNGAMIEFLADTNGAGHLMFTDTGGTNRGRISYHHNGDFLRFDTAGNPRMYITSAGRMGIGHDAPEAALQVETDVDDVPAFQVGRASTGRFFRLSEINNQNAFDKCEMSFYDNGLREILTLQNAYAAAGGNWGTKIVYRGHGGGKTGSIRCYNTVADSATSSLGLCASGNEDAIKIDHNGIVTKQFQPWFFARATQVNVDLSSTAKLPFNQETTDINNDYNDGTYQFEAPVSGSYMFVVYAYRNSSSSGEIAFYKNNSLFQRIRPVPNSGDFIFHGVTYLYLSANDTLDVRAYNGTFDNFYGNSSQQFSSFAGGLIS